VLRGEWLRAESAVDHQRPRHEPRMQTAVPPPLDARILARRALTAYRASTMPAVSHLHLIA